MAYILIQENIACLYSKYSICMATGEDTFVPPFCQINLTSTSMVGGEWRASCAKCEVNYVRPSRDLDSFGPLASSAIIYTYLPSSEIIVGHQTSQWPWLRGFFAFRCGHDLLPTSTMHMTAIPRVSVNAGGFFSRHGMVGSNSRCIYVMGVAVGRLHSPAQLVFRGT
jgi:hypothetical protein